MLGVVVIYTHVKNMVKLLDFSQPQFLSLSSVKDHF